MDELRQAAESMKRTYSANDPEQASDEAHTIHNPVVKGNETQHEGVTLPPLKHRRARRNKSRSLLKLTCLSRRKPLP